MRTSGNKMTRITMAAWAFAAVLGLVVTTPLQTAAKEAATPGMDSPAPPYDECLITRVNKVAVEAGEGGNFSEQNITALKASDHAPYPLVLVDVDATPLSCVDARNEHAVIGAFGGDIGEFLTGLDAYRQYCTANQSVTDAQVLDMMKAFVNAHTTVQRPFYMHTDNNSLAALLDALQLDSFPNTAPNDALKNKIYKTMFNTTVRYIGCGHIYYAMNNPQGYNTSKPMFEAALKGFLELFWNPDYANRTYFDVVLGTMDAHGVVHVRLNQVPLKPGQKLRKASQCVDKAVPLRPRVCLGNRCPATNARDFKKSNSYINAPEVDVFTHHDTAVERHRHKTVVPFFLDYCKKSNLRAAKKMTHDKFEAALSAIAEIWADATLEHLKALPDQKPHVLLTVDVQAP